MGGEVASRRTVKSVGFDIGKRADPPALIGLERVEGSPLQELTLCVQLPLGLPYPRLVRLVEKVVEQADVVMVDGNGVGEAIYDYLRGSFTKCWSVLTTGGRQGSVNVQQQMLNIPKAVMVEQLVRDIEKGRLHFQRVGHFAALMDELRTMRRTQGGRSTTIKYEAQSGKHDDLVMALALARLGFGVEGMEDLAA